jgi:hypothetical protein
VCTRPCLGLPCDSPVGRWSEPEFIPRHCEQGAQTYALLLLVSLAGGFIFNIYYAKEEEGFGQLFAARAPARLG